MPLSWNRYSYVLGDPINSRDPKGLEDADDDGDGGWDVDDSGDGGSGGGDTGSGDGDDNSVNYTTKNVTGTQADGTPIVGDPSTTSGITVDGSQPSVSTDPSSTNALNNLPAPSLFTLTIPGHELLRARREWHSDEPGGFCLCRTRSPLSKLGHFISE